MGRSRKPENERKRKISVSLTPVHLEQLKRMDTESLSEAVRIMIDSYYDNHDIDDNKE